MGFLNDEFEHSLRLGLAALYEHMPDAAALFIAFGPYSPGQIINFVVSATGAKKLKLGMSEIGQARFEAFVAAANSEALETQYGVKAALAMHWFLIDEPPFDYVIQRILFRVEEEVPQHQQLPQDLNDLDIITEFIKAPGS